MNLQEIPATSAGTVTDAEATIEPGTRISREFGALRCEGRSRQSACNGGQTLDRTRRALWTLSGRYLCGTCYRDAVKVLAS